VTQSLDASPLEAILSDIDRALRARLFYPAIVVALTVPEICCGLALTKADVIGEKRYAAFVDKYTTPSELGTDGPDCYRLRCGIIHRGNAQGHRKALVTHTIFTPPGGPTVHAISIQNGNFTAGMFSMDDFCGAMIAAARRWLDDNKDNQTVINNMPHLLSLRPHGMFPFINGTPVVASGS
jgi:hypothetical protein